MRTFRAWIGVRGSNEDRVHSDVCEGSRLRLCLHYRMLDLETKRSRILIRFVWRRRPLHFSITAFFRPHVGRVLLRVGPKWGEMI